MTKIVYQPKAFSAASLEVIRQANKIIAEYAAQDFSLTLRQLYYQFVARGLLPNKQTEYKRLGSIINDARLAGLIDWEAIEDRTRNLQRLAHFRDPQSLMDAALYSFRHDKWIGQDFRVEVWIEKEALSGVIEPICHELDVPFFACRGYSSQSEQWAAGQRFTLCAKNGVTPVILHFGDHDPSGIDMTRDNNDRLNMFVGHHTQGTGVIVERLALNMDQVELYHPPPNPAKLTDSRSTGYIEEYGDESWELDALDPPVIAALIRQGVEKYRDDILWEEAVRREAKEREQIESLRDRWPEVVTFLGED